MRAFGVIAAAMAEGAGPIPVGRKLASLAFLRAGWDSAAWASMGSWQPCWLLPTCRVIYDDDTWLPVDSFRPCDPYDYWYDLMPNPWTNLIWRVGWSGNCAGGSPVTLRVVEWVNPYPSKTVKSLIFFTPGYEEYDGRKRSNPQCEAIVAVTGIEPIEQDLNYWSRRSDRPPLLPPLKAPAHSGVALRRMEEAQGDGGRYSLRLKGPEGEVNSGLTVTPGAGYWTSGTAPMDCGQVACNANYKPFAVVQTFEPAVRLCRLEVRGPTYGIEFAYALGRNHRLDVTVEVSEDGNAWRRVGELKGITGDADFLPVEFEPALVKKLRLTATAEPYHEDYAPGMADERAGEDYPYFVWRLYAPRSDGQSARTLRKVVQPAGAALGKTRTSGNMAGLERTYELN